MEKALNGLANARNSARKPLFIGIERLLAWLFFDWRQHRKALSLLNFVRIRALVGFVAKEHVVGQFGANYVENFTIVRAGAGDADILRTGQSACLGSPDNMDTDPVIVQFLGRTVAVVG